jgi:hypothetical protein
MARRGQVLAWLALAGVLSLARTSAADEEEPPKPDGVDIGLRAGLGLPLGTLAGNTDFSSLMSGLIPFTLEIGGRFNRDYTAAVFFQYGIGQVKNGNTTGCGNAYGSCSAADYRFGLELLYRLTELGTFTRTFTPWLGFGFGYEVLTVSYAGLAYQGPSMLRGLEFGSVQAGGDLHVTPSFAVGPYASCSFGEFSGEQSATVAIHSWLQLGFRAAWSLSSLGD